MGQNRRYDMVSADIARWERQQALRPTPIGLTIEQVGNRRQDAVTPVPVAAWVPHHVAYVEQQVLHGVAVAWTKDAVLVRYPTDHGDAHVWVWASAVTRTDTPNRRGAE